MYVESGRRMKSRDAAWKCRCLALLILLALSFCYGSFYASRVGISERDTVIYNVRSSAVPTDDMFSSTKIGAAARFNPQVCDARYTEIIPCLDRSMLRKLKIKVNYTLMEHYERHCPPSSRKLSCLIPLPANYKVPIRWPASRDQIWRANVPHSLLARQKSDQHWMVVNEETVMFPGGGTHFHDGADKYIAALAKMLKFPEEKINNKGEIRTVLDIGCGVGSFGAYLLSSDVLTMSIAPNDVHENQIQFTLERGIPAMLGVMSTMRLTFPTHSFDMIHCSRCRIQWTERKGILLMEVDRLLRLNGYFAWSSPPAYRDDEEDKRIWNEMNVLTSRMGWSIVAKEGQTVIWKKLSTRVNDSLVCKAHHLSHAVWHVPMKPCITLVMQNDKILPWPKRLNSPPHRLQHFGISEEEYSKDSNVWKRRVKSYWHHLGSQVEQNSIRNVMDMKANLGGFAAAINGKPMWVMNVVPSTSIDTLSIVYDRGLIGTVHNWCESFSTYPRTYDMLHACGLFTEIAEAECSSIEELLLEMDRIIRPTGIIIIRDTVDMVNEVMKYLDGLHWHAWHKEVTPMKDSLSHLSKEEKILFARKQLWHPSSSK